MPFKLEVEFRGLCLFVVHPDGQQVAVVMPDARVQKDPVQHADGGPASPHVGYVTCELGDVVGSGGMRGQIVHRFLFEDLAFDGVAPAAADHTLALPDFDCIAKGTRPIDGMFATPAHAAVLMRTVLRGGALRSTGSSAFWDFETPFGSRADTCGDCYVDAITWEVDVPRELRLRITGWRGAPEMTIPLTAPDGATVRVKIANLCSDDPLRWPGFGGPRKMDGLYDEDFRWFYKILLPETGTFEELVRRTNGKLPVPHLQPDASPCSSRTLPPGCDPGKVLFAF